MFVTTCRCHRGDVKRSLSRGLTGEELQHRGRHGDRRRDVGELDDERREELDHDVGHLHGAHGQGDHTLLGTAVDEARIEALHQLSLQGRAHAGDTHVARLTLNRPGVKRLWLSLQRSTRDERSASTAVQTTFHLDHG